MPGHPTIAHHFPQLSEESVSLPPSIVTCFEHGTNPFFSRWRSEEHTSELQSQSNLVCRLLLEKKKELRTAGYRPPRNGRSGRSSRSPRNAHAPPRPARHRPGPAPGPPPCVLRSHPGSLSTPGN